MRLTTKGRFAVTAMIDVALNAHAGPVALAEVSERQHISLSYLEQLFAKLRRRGLVDSVRGPGGGYMLGKPVAVMSVADIILAVDEPIDATNCSGKENCHDDGGLDVGRRCFRQYHHCDEQRRRARLGSFAGHGRRLRNALWRAVHAGVDRPRARRTWFSYARKSKLRPQR